MKGHKSYRLFLIALTVLLGLTACSQNKENAASSETPTSPASPAASSSGSEETPDPFGKYDPPITISTVKVFNSADKFEPGETPEKNIWSDAILADLGIAIKLNWSVIGDEPGGAGEQKLNITIASNDIPDIIPVNAKQLKQLVDNDMAEDLTEAIEKYASPQYKKFLESNGGLAVKTATFDGKVRALPVTTAGLDDAPMIWIRKDWLDKLQLPEPKTMDDILSISDAFTNRDPDGNGRKDTFGLGIGKDLYNGGLHDLTGFFEGYHAYKNLWIEGSDGKLAYGGIRPEMKTALAKLQEMFKTGQIDPEFGVKDAGKVNEAVVSGKIGMFYGAHWNAFWPLPDSYKQDSNAVWKPYPIVSADDKPASPSVGLGAGSYFVFKKGAQHPEAIVKLANYYADKEYGWDTGGIDLSFHQPVPNPDGYIRWRFAPVYATDPEQNINIYRGLKAVVENNDQNALKNLQVKDNYDNYTKFAKDGDQSQYATALWTAPQDSGLSVLDYYLSNGLGQSDRFYGSKTDAMVDKQSTLEKLQLESFTKIVMGAASIDSFDQFVSDWKKLGGDTITQEVNDWYTANQ